MCGIFCIVSNSQNTHQNVPNEFKEIENNILRRGPDLFEICQCKEFNIFFAASVLWLQGDKITTQPVESENSIFVYNGDVFSGAISDEDRITQGDTTLFLEQLESSKEITKVLSHIHGPYAFVYLDKKNAKLYFGRDIYGRRSLLIGKKGEDLILTSVAKRNLGYDLIELPSIGTFCYELETKKLHIYPWEYRNSNFFHKLQELEEFLHDKIEYNQQVTLLENKIFLKPSDNELEYLELFKNASDGFENLLHSELWLKKVNKLKSLLENAIQKRISTQPEFCNNCIKLKKNCNHATTGVLFSGGIDCAILALLADKYVDKSRPIDLINVAFDENRNYETPDRITGLQTFEELKILCPDRQWNFLAVNVPKDELNTERKDHIADLIYPLTTILDDSLGCALWFAARGKAEKYVSPSRILLVGMGADELFGGYTRHRASLKREGWKGLHDMLDHDWENISQRNLARDDRVVSDHGRQLRTPYLDENLVSYVRDLNSWEKTCPSSAIPQGYGEKILLRSLGYHLGLKNAATFKKRALQFGSRIANSKENAHDICERLIN